MYCAAVWQHSSNSIIKIVHNSIEHFLWNPSDSFSDDVLSCLWNAFTNSVFQAPPQKIVLGGWDLGNRMAQGYWFDAKWVCLMGSYAWGIQCSVQEMRWCLISRTVHSPHFSNRTLEYLRHNFPWDRLILRQTDNPWPSYSQDLNPPDYFLREYLKDRVCENNPQTREDFIRRKIRRIPQEMLSRVVNNFNVRVAAVLSYSSAVHGTNIALMTGKV